MSQGIDYPFTKAPHLFLARLAPYLDEVELRLLMYACWRLLGHHTREGRISQREFEQGRRSGRGELLDEGAGVCGPAVREGLKRLDRIGALRTLGPPNNAGTPLLINADPEAIDWEFLEERQAARRAKNQQRTAGARRNNPKHAAAVGRSPTTPPPHTNGAGSGVVGLHPVGGQLDYTGGGKSDYTPPVIGLHRGVKSDYTPPVIGLHRHDHEESMTQESLEESHAPAGASGSAGASPAHDLAELLKGTIGQVKEQLEQLSDDDLGALHARESCAARPRKGLLDLIERHREDRRNPALDPLGIVVDLESALRLLDDMEYKGRRVRGGAGGVAMALYEARFAADTVRKYPPDRARLATIAKLVSGGARWLCETIARTPVDIQGDPHDYVHTMARRSPALRTDEKEKDGKRPRYEQRPGPGPEQGDRRNGGSPDRESGGAVERVDAGAPPAYGTKEYRAQRFKAAQERNGAGRLAG